MDRTEFFRRQVARLSKLADECVDPDVTAKLREIAGEYRAMLNGRAPDQDQPRTPAE